MGEVLAEEPQRLSDEEIVERFRRARNRPNSSDLLGFEIISADSAAMTVEVAFEGRVEFTNPMGHIQGGFLCAMLDDCMSIAGVVASGFTCVMPTLEMKTSFLRPASPGRLRGVGRVAKWGRTIAFTEGELYDAENRLLAKATATAMPTPRAKLKG